MTIESQAIEWVRIVAQRLGDLRDKVVFLGGATVGLLITDQATTAVRATKDVDVIVEVGSWGEYAPLQEKLREKNFKEDTDEDAPLCRWIIDGIKVDVMPTAEQILGFSNRWYGPAMKTAQCMQLTDELTIRIVSPPYFVATKIEAFHGRGGGDYQVRPVNALGTTRRIFNRRVRTRPLPDEVPETTPDALCRHGPDAKLSPSASPKRCRYGESVRRLFQVSFQKSRPKPARLATLPDLWSSRHRSPQCRPHPPSSFESTVSPAHYRAGGPPDI